MPVVFPISPPTSSGQTVVTVPVYDYLYASGDPSNNTVSPLSGKRVKVTLNFSQASSQSPVTALDTGPTYALTDNNGFWKVNLVPTDLINPSGVLYQVEIEGIRTAYLINPTSAGVPAGGWQSSAILVSAPVGLGVAGFFLPGGIQISPNGDIAVRSLTVDPAAPLVPASDPGSIMNDYWCPPPSGSAAIDTAAVTAAMNAAIAATAGRVLLQRTKAGSPYLFNASLPAINLPGISIVGPGSGQCVLQPTSALTGDLIRVQMSPFSNTIQASVQLVGFTVDGTNASAGACGVHWGDTVGGEISDVFVRNFQGGAPSTPATASKGWWFDNRTNWTEGLRSYGARANNCTIGFLFDVNGGNVSFAHNFFYGTRINPSPPNPSYGICLRNGAALVNGVLHVTMNMDIGATAVKMLDTSTIGFANAGENLILVAETANSSSTGLDIGASANLFGTGEIDFSLGGMTNTNAGPGGNIQFLGRFVAPGIYTPAGEGGQAMLGLTIPTGRLRIISDALQMDLATSKIIPGATALNFRDNADANTNLQILNGGGFNFRGALTFTTPNSQLQPGSTAFNIVNNAFTQTNLTLTDAGYLTLINGSIGTALAAPAYSASITPNARAGNWQTITVTNATAFTINGPSNPPTAAITQELTIEIFNNSGGAMGAITWSGAFILVGGAFTNPASTKHRFITFKWNGANWVEIARAAADY